ncbi:MAG: hypothetical protein ABI700_00920 [Chloroflexota bacterium]
MNNPLIANLAHLESAAQLTPRMQLMITISSYDTPLGRLQVDHNDPMEDYDGDPDAAFEYGMATLRRKFPDIFALALRATTRGATESQVEHLVDEQLSAIDLPSNDFDSLASGYIALYADGISLGDPDTWDHYLQLEPVIRMLDPNAPEDLDGYDVAEIVPETAYYLINSLNQSPALEALTDLSGFLQWLFNESGTSLIDVTAEDHDQYQPLMWNAPGDIEFAQILNREATVIKENIANTFERHLNNAPLMCVLQKNIKRIQKQIGKKGYKPTKATLNEYTITLHWNY